MNLRQKQKYFLKIITLAERKYSNSNKRLASEGWKHNWQVLIATIYSAQSRDELTIPVMESCFAELDTLEKFASVDLRKLEKLTRKINYYKTKSKNAKSTAQLLLSDFNGLVADNMQDLLSLPGVGRKTANLVLSEIHNKDGICVDTHVHRLANVLGLVKTKNPTETEFELQKVAPKKYWSRINRVFVLWGKDVSGHDKDKILTKLTD